MTRQCLCEKCSETNPTEFYQGKKNICKTCLSEKNKKEKEEVQKLLEKAMSPKVKTPRAVSPSRDLEKIIEAQNIKINFLETELSRIIPIIEYVDKTFYENIKIRFEKAEGEINKLYDLLEKKEEVQSVKIVSPVKCELPLPLPVVQEKVKVTHKVKTPVKRSTKEKEEIKENIENLNSKTVKELTELAKKYGLPVPLNRRGKEDRIEDLKKFLS